MEISQTKERSAGILNWGRDSTESFKYNTDMKKIRHDGTHLCSETSCIRLALGLFGGTIALMQRADGQKHLTLCATNSSFLSVLLHCAHYTFVISITLHVPTASFSAPQSPSFSEHLSHSADTSTVAFRMAGCPARERMMK